MKFISFLVARHSPQNDCFANDGEILCLLPNGREKSLDFIGITSKALSRYGWVKKADKPFTLEHFLSQANFISEHADAQRVFLESISQLVEGTPVAADYFPRGLPPKLELVVHKVIFHK